MSMNISSPTPGALSATKLRGIYWKTFVGFVGKDVSYVPNETPSIAQLSRMQRRQGSFEYMELTARVGGGSTTTSESVNSCISSTNSSMESLKEDRSSMYAVLDMSNTQKEISLNNDVTIIEEPGDEQSFDMNMTRSLLASPIPLVVTSPKCSPIFVTNIDHTGSGLAIPMQKDRHLYNKETVDNDKLTVDYESEENSFDRLESTSPSMEPAPWKDQDLSIQLWMVPHFLSENDDKLVSMPPFPEFDHCHYVPTLEAILEESEESSDGRNLSRSRLTKSASFSDDTTDLSSLADELNHRRSNSLGDVVTTFPHSQDDLFSITATFGSVNSMRRITTFENLNTEEKDGDEHVDVDSDGSSDELDRAACYDSTSERNSHIESDETRVTSPNCSEISECVNPEVKPESSVSNIMDETHEEASGSEVAANEVSEKHTSESCRDIFPESAAPSVASTDFLSSGRSSPMIESAPEFYEYYSGLRSKSPSIRRDSGFTISDIDVPNYSISDNSKPSTYSRDSGVTINDIDIPGLPQELYFDSKDLPQIVVMFAQQEIEKERKAREEEESNSPASTNGYCRRSDRDSEFDSPHGGAVQKRISQLKIADTSRLSTLSSSTPELSVANDECLLYIPVSYASEAAAKKKRKRNATLANTGPVQRRTNLTKAAHTRSLISGTGLGNGFSSLRKRLRSRKSTTSTTLRRSQSEKPQLSYSSPDVSGPMARFLNSPRRRAKLKSESPPDNDDTKGKSIKKKFSKVFRRLSSKFSSQRRPVVVKRDYSVIEQSSPAKSSIDEYAGDTSETLSSQSKDSPFNTPYKYGLGNDLLLSRDADSKFLRDYRNRSHSVPMRPRSQTSSLRNGSTGSDVFDSQQSEESLNTTVYV